MTITLQVALTLVVFFIAIRAIIKTLYKEQELPDNVAVYFGGLALLMMVSIVAAAVEMIWFH